VEWDASLLFYRYYTASMNHVLIMPITFFRLIEVASKLNSADLSEKCYCDALLALKRSVERSTEGDG
jgi:hypothetical protein